MTTIETQLCDILGLTDPAQLPAKVKSLHDRYGDEVWPGRGPIPCFCWETNVVTRQKLGARPDEPVFSAADRVVGQNRVLAELANELQVKLSATATVAQERDELRWELGEVVKARDEALEKVRMLEDMIQHPPREMGN